MWFCPNALMEQALIGKCIKCGCFACKLSHAKHFIGEGNPIHHISSPSTWYIKFTCMSLQDVLLLSQHCGSWAPEEEDTQSILTHTYALTHSRYAHVSMHAHMHTYMHTRVHARTHAHAHTRMHAHAHTHTHTHARTRTHTLLHAP